MLARNNYSYQKYKKELARKTKHQEKIQRRLDKKNIQPKEGIEQPSGEDSAVNNSLA